METNEQRVLEKSYCLDEENQTTYLIGKKTALKNSHRDFTD